MERVVAGTWQARLFRIASLTWSVPVSNGFGRRLRYLVWDSHNDKLIGIIAIGDPVFNLSVRDTLVGWDVHDRATRLVNVMDAYVLGALPPYNTLLGGKMVACLVRTRDIYDDFANAYGRSVGIISGKRKKARPARGNHLFLDGPLVRLQPTEAQWRSLLSFHRYTGGWGHFHIPDDLFLEMRDYLRGIGHRYADQHRFGQGPNWRLRTTRAALAELGFRDDLLRHGVQREVFLACLAANATEILCTGKGTPDLASLLDVPQVAHLALDRWVVPRSERRPEYRSWKREHVLSLLADRLPIHSPRQASLAI